MSRGTVGDRALKRLLSNAKKLSAQRFRDLGDATLKTIATRARGETSLTAFSGQRLAAAATKEINARKKKKKK